MIKNIIIDCGHGGIDSNGNYTTAPKKMFRFDDNNTSYEGVFNRQIGLKLGNVLKSLNYKVNYSVHPSNSEDLPLKERVFFANSFNKNSTLFLSLHSNASPSHNARGFEIWTSVGETKSDIIASYIGTEIEKGFPSLKFRTDYSDKDIDKESQFYVLKNTNCSAVLLENLFFDNKDDYDLLCSETFQECLVLTISKGIIRYLESI